MFAPDPTSINSKAFSEIDSRALFPIREELFPVISEQTDATTARLILSDPRTQMAQQAEVVTISNSLLVGGNREIHSSLTLDKGLTLGTQTSYSSNYPLGSIKSVDWAKLSHDSPIRIALETAAQIPFDTVNELSLGNLRIAAFAKSAEFIVKSGSPELGQEIIRACFDYYAYRRMEGKPSRVVQDDLLDYAISVGDEALWTSLLCGVRMDLSSPKEEANCRGKLALNADLAVKQIQADPKLYLALASEVNPLDRNSLLTKFLRSSDVNLDYCQFVKFVRLAMPAKLVVDLPTVEIAEAETESEIQHTYANALSYSLCEMKRLGAEQLIMELISVYAKDAMFSEALSCIDCLNTRTYQLCAYGKLLGHSTVLDLGNPEDYRQKIDEVLASSDANSRDEHIAIMLRSVALEVPEGCRGLSHYILQIVSPSHRAKYELLFSLALADSPEIEKGRLSFLPALPDSQDTSYRGQPMRVLADIALVACSWEHGSAVVGQLDGLLDDVPDQLKYIEDGELYYDFVVCAHNLGMHEIVARRASQCAESCPMRISTLLLGARSAYAAKQTEQSRTLLIQALNDIVPQGVMDEFSRQSEIESLGEVLEEQWKGNPLELLGATLRLSTLSGKEPWRVSFDRHIELLKTAVAVDARDMIAKIVRACSKLIEENSKDESMYYRVIRALSEAEVPIKTKSMIFP